jgi:hypothetical protein
MARMPQNAEDSDGSLSSGRMPPTASTIKQSSDPVATVGQIAGNITEPYILQNDFEDDITDHTTDKNVIGSRAMIYGDTQYNSSIDKPTGLGFYHYCDGLDGTKNPATNWFSRDTTDAKNNILTRIRHDGALVYWDGSSYTKFLPAGTIDNKTWYFIEYDLDWSGGTFDLSIYATDGNLVDSATSLTLSNNGNDVDLIDWAVYDDAVTCYVDYYVLDD